MIDNIRNYKKQILKTILLNIERDVRSTTGLNLRLLMRESDKCDISEIQKSDIETLPYFQLGEDEEWRIGMIRHLLEEIQQGPLDQEDQEWLQHLCCN